MMPPSKQFPHDNVIRPIQSGCYRLNGLDYSSVRLVMEVVLEMKFPFRPKKYICSYYAPEEDENGIFETNEIHMVLTTAFNYPNKFKCSGLTEDEEEFINAMLAYKIAEKLIK